MFRRGRRVLIDRREGAKTELTSQKLVQKTACSAFLMSRVKEQDNLPLGRQDPYPPRRRVCSEEEVTRAMTSSTVSVADEGSREERVPNLSKFRERE